MLRHGSGYEGGKLRIAALYQGNPTPKEAQAFLKDEYGIGGHSHTWLDGTNGFVDYNSRGIRLSRRGFTEEVNMRWPAVEQQIRYMVQNGLYLNEAEQERLTDMQRLYADTGLPAPNARMVYPPTVLTPDGGDRQIDGPEGSDDETEPDDTGMFAADEEPVQSSDTFSEANRTDIGEGRAAAESPASSQPSFAYDLHPGDTIYMDGRPFTVDEVRHYEDRKSVV